MELRKLLGWVPVAALAALALSACKGKEDSNAKDAPPKRAPPTLDQLNQRCEQLGKACGEKEKHQEKITEDCKAAAKSQIDKGCGDEAVALYDCYEKEICAKINKVWAIDDFRVLADRHNKCVAERDAGIKCLGDAKK